MRHSTIWQQRDSITGELALHFLMQAAPFSFPPPLKIINEKCTEGGAAFKDKSLGLWRLADIQQNVLKMVG